jgi:hypothetical protein
VKASVEAAARDLHVVFQPAFNALKCIVACVERLVAVVVCAGDNGAVAVEVAVVA